MTSFSKQSQVTSLPPTLGIKDAETRAFLDALVNAWDLRSGNTRQEDAERFVTLGEINKLTNRALKQAFSGGVIGGANGGTSGSNPTEAEIGDLIDNLVDSIRKSILYQLLETQLKPIDLQNLKSKIDASIGEIGAKIIQEQEIRSTADEALVTQLNLLVARVSGSEAAIAQELEVRASKDNALARAINTMWAAVGNNQAVIEDGQLATAGSVAAQATKWNQVVASVTDPNTGQINAASIKQELTAYANAADGKFNAIYSVRAQVDVGGRTIVGGFGLAAMSGATSGSGPTIDFGVRADRFYIAATADSGSVASQMAPNLNSMPFIVVTSPQYYDGILYQPGVYMKTAMIADATIGTAKISDASITNAKIQNASIDTLHIRGNAVTVPMWVQTFGASSGSNLPVTQNNLYARLYYDQSIVPNGTPMLVTATMHIYCGGPSGGKVDLYLKTANGGYFNGWLHSLTPGYDTTVTITTVIAASGGYVEVGNTSGGSSGPLISLGFITLSAVAAKR